MMIKNFTPHAITVRVFSGTERVPEDFVYSPEPIGARVAQLPPKELPPMGQFPVVASPEFGEVVGLPAPSPGVVYLVSGLVLAHCSGRADVFAPDTSPSGAVRDPGGRIIATLGLVAAPG